jgi:hypothetical protein
MTNHTLPTQPDETLRNSAFMPHVVLLRPDPPPHPRAAQPPGLIGCVVKDCPKIPAATVEVWRVDPDRIVRRLHCCEDHGRAIVVGVGRWTAHDRLDGPITITFDEAPRVTTTEGDVTDADVPLRGLRQLLSALNETRFTPSLNVVDGQSLNVYVAKGDFDPNRTWCNAIWSLTTGEVRMCEWSHVDDDRDVIRHTLDIPALAAWIRDGMPT